jgi:signal transduction histidine kinase
MSITASVSPEATLRDKTNAMVLGDRIAMVFTLLMLIVGGSALIFTTVVGVRWYNTPSIGALFYRNAYIFNARTFTGQPLAGIETGLQGEDRILQVNDFRLDNTTAAGFDLNSYLNTQQFGQPLSISVFRTTDRLVIDSVGNIPSACAAVEGGAVCTYTYTFTQLRLGDFFGFFGLGFVLAVACYGMALWLFIRQRAVAMARVTSMVAVCVVLIALARFEIGATFYTTALLALGFCYLGGLNLQIGMLFPYPLLVVRRQPRLRWLSYLAPFGSFLIYFAIAVLLDNYEGTLILPALWAIITGFFIIGSLLYKRRRSTSALAREQATVVLLGLALALVPFPIWLALTGIENFLNLPNVTFSTIYLQLPAIFYPLALAYAFSQARIIDADKLASEGVIVAVLSLMLIIGYTMITTAVYVLTAGLLRPDHPLAIGATLAAVALLFMPIRLRLERYVEEAFFKQRREYDRRLEQFARALTTAIQTNDIVRLTQTEIQDTLTPLYLFLFLRDSKSGDYESIIDPVSRKPQTDLRFRGDGGLLRLLGSSRTVIDLNNENISPAELGPDRPRIAVLNTKVLARLRSVQRLSGFVALGPRADGSTYSHEELRFLEGVADQAAAAFERAQVVDEAQRNEKDLQVLVQFSQSLNIEMDFDTLLEFVFAQVDKIVSAPNFYIMLRDPNADELYYAFYQEYEDRQTERESMRRPMGRDLFSEVIRGKKSIDTDNYVREMQRRDSSNLIENNNLRAWLGVPMNAAEGQTLGCMAIASTDPNLIYTEEQKRILGSLADLAATSIYKTRLFTETSERARQMKVLNDTSARLGASFDDLDALLQQITEAAVEILRCEAGSLLLLEEETGDLVFRYVQGGAGDSILNTRVPAGSGLVGTVVSTRRYMISNEASKDKRWFGELGAGGAFPKASFSTNSILAVPLSARNKVIGVLEVLNKRDGTGFDESNADLLSAFAGQAAIAIDNANIFRETDEALGERVKQLFSMQRIDQELNRSLDFERVVELTIDNALREGNADAGALAILSEDRRYFTVVGAAGYPEKVLTVGKRLDVDEGIIGAAQRKAQMLITTLSNGTLIDPFLPAAVSQLCVPLITGDLVSGILLLESNYQNVFNTMTAEHIQALAEHANTAISNAKLFAQLGEANASRIKFVSLVAHELKNPMTSIKGYSELLLSGKMGQLSDQQSTFLSTIRRNTVRVQQLIDDLRDLTAQETGNMSLKFGPTNFPLIVLESVRPQQNGFDQKNQKVLLNVPDSLPLVWADENRLIQVMINFVSNANKYTPKGGSVTINAELVANRWSNDERAARQVIHCTVTDTGIGMSQPDLDKLFTPYWRSDNPLARAEEGTGLGMSLTRGLVEAHGGKLWVESQINVGTSFHITIPVATAEQLESVAVNG